MRASKFLQFVSKMSKGELILEDNKVRGLTRANDVAFSKQRAGFIAL
jgi:hypothetical protein